MSASELIFLHSSRMPDCRARVDKHFDGYWTLQFGESGGVVVSYGGRRSVLNDGSPWFWPAYPGPRIRFHAAPGREEWHHRYVAFQGARVARWIADGLWPAAPQRAPGSAADYAARFDDLLALAQRTDHWGLARAVHLLEGFLIELAEARASGSPPGREVPSWLDALLASDNYPAGDFTPDYETLAQTHGIALSTLRRRFKEIMGVPLHTWVMQRRIARARSLLGETELPVKAIADRLGYTDVYFFTRQFRRLVGVPPAAYRRSRQQ